MPAYPSGTSHRSHFRHCLLRGPSTLGGTSPSMTSGEPGLKEGRQYFLPQQYWACENLGQYQNSHRTRFHRHMAYLQMKFTKNFTLQALAQVSFIEVQKSTNPTFLRRFPSAPFSWLITLELINYRNLLSLFWPPLLQENLLSKIHTNLPTRYKDFQMQIITLWHPLTLKTFLLTSPFLKLSIFVLTT